MSDDLEELKAALYATAPHPDGDKKAANLALAQKNFADLQGSTQDARSTSDRPAPGWFSGVAHMLLSFSPRQVLTATTALAAVGLVVYLPSLQDGLPKIIPGSLEQTETRIAPSNAKPQGNTIAKRPATDPTAVADQAPLADLALPDSTIGPLLEPVMEPAIAELSAPPMASAPAPMPGIRMKASRQEAEPDSFGRLTRPGPDDRFTTPQHPDSESFANAAPNPVKVTAEEPVSTFSIDVDTASYAVLRSSLMNGYLPSPEQIRIEEMINYFPYNYAAPSDAAPFSTSVTTFDTPWNQGTQLVHIGLQGQMPEIDARPPLNLVFLIDTSGSMNAANKLPLLKQSFRLMLAQLRPEDQVAIVTYAGSAGQVLAPTPAGERSIILQALDRLDAGGSTAGQQGLQQAYATAASMADEGEVTRVILATDGDFNVGIHDPDQLKDFIAGKRDSGTYLSVLGFGRGNLDDATMQALAQNGNGQAAYIDTLSEAQKVLVDQLSGALFPIADDVKIQVEFNPSQIAEYRLIGYETRVLKREDFNNDQVDAGEIGAGHSVTAIYEITPVGSSARLTDPLRYGTAPEVSESDEYGFLKLRYKAPGATRSQLIESPIRPGGTVSADMRFAAAIAGFGQLLQNGQYIGDWSFGDAISLANSAKGDDAFGYRAEAVRLMRLAQSLSQP